MGKFTELLDKEFGVAEGANSAQNEVLNPQVTNSSSEGEKGLKTQNMASQKAPMMNIRFTQDNYAYVRQESAMRGLSVTGFVNWLVDQYKADPEHVHTSGVYQDEAAW